MELQQAAKGQNNATIVVLQTTNRRTYNNSTDCVNTFYTRRWCWHETLAWFVSV